MIIHLSHYRINFFSLTKLSPKWLLLYFYRVLYSKHRIKDVKREEVNGIGENLRGEHVMEYTVNIFFKYLRVSGLISSFIIQFDLNSFQLFIFWFFFVGFLGHSRRVCALRYRLGDHMGCFGIELQSVLGLHRQVYQLQATIPAPNLNLCMELKRSLSSFCCMYLSNFHNTTC